MSTEILPDEPEAGVWASLEPQLCEVGPSSDSGLRAQVDDLQLRLLESQSIHVAKLSQMRAQLAVRDDALLALQSELNCAREQFNALEGRALSASLNADAEISALRSELQLLKAESREAKVPQTQIGRSASDRQTWAQNDGRGASRAVASTAVLETELSAAISERDAARADLAKRDSELRSIEAHVSEQQSRIRALHEQLATFITREAADGARVDDAVARAIESEAELAKRRQQLNKVVKALTRLRERELATAGAAAIQVRAMVGNDEPCPSFDVRTGCRAH